jgi:hypothetical protein
MDANKQRTSSFELACETSKGMNQILKARGPRGGELLEETVEGTTTTINMDGAEITAETTGITAALTGAETTTED